MRYYSAALLFLTLIFGISICAAFGFYPAALVVPGPASDAQPHIIWARSVRRVAHATLLYYEHALETASSPLRITPALSREVQNKSIQALINQIFIADAARQAVTEADIQAFMEEKLARYNAEPHFGTAIFLLYGLNSSAFVEFIARPEAEKELLQQKRGWDDAVLEQWLAEEKRRAQIVIL